MKYFLVSTETDNNPTPHMTNWFQQLNPQNITLEQVGNIPQWTQLTINNGARAVFSDVLNTPFYLLSSMVQDVINRYDPYILYKQVTLIDKAAKVVKLYHLPILPACDCLAPESELDKVRSKIIHGVIDLEKAQRRPLFKLDGVTSTHVAFRLDVVERILRCGAKGLKLTELEVKGY